MSGLPDHLAANPRLSSWLRVDPDGTIWLHSGKVEIGQGILTALAQIAADELDVALCRIRVVPATTTGPDEGYTAGSQSIERSGAAVRQVCAEVRAIYLAAAGVRLGAAVAGLRVEDGAITAETGDATSYWELADDRLLERDATGDAVPKSPGAARHVGEAAPRLDLPTKLAGGPAYVHDRRPSGLLHARMVRPDSVRATLVSVDEAAVSSLPGVVAVVREGDFLGVLAEREEIAVEAARLLRAAARWAGGERLPDEGALEAFLTSSRTETFRVAEPDAGAGRPVETVRARFSRPFLAHASIGPSCALACWHDGGLHVVSHSQGIHALRSALAEVLSINEGAVVVEHAEGAGCYGHNGADDAALDAAVLARRVPGRTVRLQWSREDELARAPFGPAMLVEVEAGIDEVGHVVTWHHQVWSNSHVMRPGYVGPGGLLATGELDAGATRPEPVDRGGMTRNAVPGYDLGAVEVVAHCVLDMPLRTSSMRSLGAFMNVFAIESVLDELAGLSGRDPVEFRLRHLCDPRARAVLEAAAEASGWGGAVGEDAGRGVGLARYKNAAGWCAVVADVTAFDRIRVERLTVVADVGLVVNPDGVANQIEGGAIQATSWALCERVRFGPSAVTSATWADYPILRFSEVPAVAVHLLSRPDEPALGAGEIAAGPTVAAIANAAASALGVRFRTLPFTAEIVAETLRTSVVAGTPTSRIRSH